MNKHSRSLFILAVIFLIAGTILAGMMAGCSGSDSGDGGDVSPTPTSSATVTPTGTPMLVWVSTRGGQDEGTNIYQAQIDFANGALLNTETMTESLSGAQYNDPYICPLHTKIFCAMTQGSLIWNDIWAVDVADGDVTNMTNSSETRDNTRPLITSQFLVYYSSQVRETGVQEIRVMGTDGSSEQLYYTIGEQSIDSMALSPDELTIALALRDSDGGTDIYTLNRSSKVLTQVTDTADIHEYSVNYNSSGKLIYLAEGDVTDQFDIYQMDPDGTDIVKITNGEMAYNGPVWQYGRYYVFQSGNDIYFYDSSTQTNTNLTGSDGFNYSHYIYEN